MDKFYVGQRVKVLRVFVGSDRIEVNAPGSVRRTRRQDDGAWVHLDERHTDARVHPFPAGDARESSVMAWPEDCEALP